MATEEETTPESTEITELTEEVKTEPTPEYKAIQQTLSKREQELAVTQKKLEILEAQQPSREIAQAIAEQGQRLDQLSDIIEDLGKRQEAAEKGEEYKPAPSPVREARRLKQVADEILADHGFSPLDPRFKDARKDADPLRAVNRKIREVHQEEEAKRKADFDKLVEERVKEQWQQHLKDHADDFKAESGGPSGGGGDEQE